MAIIINEDMTFTCRQVGEMLGLPTNRVQYLVANTDMIPYTKTKDGTGHYRIRFADLDKVELADKSVRKVGASSAAKHTSDVEALGRRVSVLEQLLDELTAPISAAR